KCRDQMAFTLNGLERRKLELARALVTEPKVILLDEPLRAQDPAAVRELQAEILRLKNEFRKGVLLTDHNVARTLKVCDRVMVMDDGRIFANGSPREIIGGGDPCA